MAWYRARAPALGTARGAGNRQTEVSSMSSDDLQSIVDELAERLQ